MISKTLSTFSSFLRHHARYFREIKCRVLFMHKFYAYLPFLIYLNFSTFPNMVIMICFEYFKAKITKLPARLVIMVCKKFTRSKLDFKLLIVMKHYLHTYCFFCNTGCSLDILFFQRFSNIFWTLGLSRFPLSVSVCTQWQVKHQCCRRTCAIF